MFYFLYTFAATSCTSLENKPRTCMTKSELEANGVGYATSLMRNGDPCFMNFNKERVVYLSYPLKSS